jgi:hypothetical protein
MIDHMSKLKYHIPQEEIEKSVSASKMDVAYSDALSIDDISRMLFAPSLFRVNKHHFRYEPCHKNVKCEIL